MFTAENFIKGIATTIPDLSLEVQVEKLLLSRRRFFENPDGECQKFGEIPIAELRQIESDLTDAFSLNGLMHASKTSFEVAVQYPSRIRFPPYHFERGAFSISEHNYNFVVSKASSHYIFALFCHNAEHPDSGYELGMLYPRFNRQEIITSAQEFSDAFRIYSVKITNKRSHKLSEYKRLLDSYLFNISYNHNLTLSIAEFSKIRSHFDRRVQQHGQLFPYKYYKPELTIYYHQAVFTDIAFAQYLAFYHVAEYYFQTISREDIFKEIQNFITSPSFFVYNNKNIESFYTAIRKKMREQRDDGVWNEKTGLLLCLKKYIPNLDSLKTSLTSIDSSIVNYYRDNLVKFADDSKTINFDDDPDKIYEDIRDRVYSVRNAIVHSKEGERLRYEPFKHDKHLAKEIALIRSIAEEIIINSAKPIEFLINEKTQIP